MNPSVTTVSGREFSLIELATLILKRRRTLIVTPLIVTVVAVAFLLIRGRRYSADSAFRPQVSDASPSRFAGLAAQFGLSLPGAILGDPIRFYAELAKSRDVLRSVIQTEYRFKPWPNSAPADSMHGNLIRLFKVSAKNPDDEMRIALSRLASKVDAQTNRDAGLVRLRVITEWPELSVLINRRILELMDEANKERRQSQAGAERKFIERRLDEARDTLAQAERDQERFLQQNRRYQDSPQLMLQYNQLQRRVDLRQQVFTSLSQAYEQARIDEVRDTPQLTIIDQPEGSARKAGSRAMDAIMWGLIGCVLGLVFAVLQEVFERQRAADPMGYAELTRSIRGFWPFGKAGAS